MEEKSTCSGCFFYVRTERWLTLILKDLLNEESYFPFISFYCFRRM
jgi:hypothetical protein